MTEVAMKLRHNYALIPFTGQVFSRNLDLHNSCKQRNREF